MGIANRVMTGLGIGRKESESDSSINGIRSMSSLAYVGDAHKGHFLDIFWSKETLDPIPMIFYFNGGSFDRTNRGQGSNLCRFLAKRGFLVVNAEFRDLGKKVTVLDELDDLQSMVKWVFRNTEKYKIDPDNVYAIGSSYGALMALWMTMICNGSRMPQAMGIEPMKFKIKGLGLLMGMTDTESGDPVMRTIADSIRDVGKTDKELAECLIPWSNHDLRVLPPVFQVTSEYEPSLPDVVRMDTLLDTNGVVHETMTFPGNQHTAGGFMEDHASSPECTRAISRMLLVFGRQ